MPDKKIGWVLLVKGVLIILITLFVIFMSSCDPEKEIVENGKQISIFAGLIKIY